MKELIAAHMTACTKCFTIRHKHNNIYICIKSGCGVLPSPPTHTHTYTRAHIHTHIHTHTRTYEQNYTHTHTHTYIHTHTHTNEGMDGECSKVMRDAIHSKSACNHHRHGQSILSQTYLFAGIYIYAFTCICAHMPIRMYINNTHRITIAMDRVFFHRPIRSQVSTHVYTCMYTHTYAYVYKKNT
jgi:hypothetical protein